MKEAKLLINSEDEIELVGEVVTIGRAADNVVSFSEDSNVSRYHAEIEKQGEKEYWVFDLNSSNGTTVNGEKVTTEKPLYDGDIIVFGGTSKIEILLSPREDSEEDKDEEKSEKNEKKEENKDETVQEQTPQKKSSLSWLLVVAGLAIGLAVLCVLAATIYYFTRGNNTIAGCNASAEIVSPQDGSFINKPTNIEIELQDGECVQKVVYLLDGKPITTVESAPFSATLDPKQFPDEAASGLDSKLTLMLLGENDQQISKSEEITFALQTRRTKKPVDSDNGEEFPELTQRPTGPVVVQDSQTSLIDTQKMSIKVIPQFAGSFEYKANNQNFLRAVRKMQAEYASGGYFARAQKYSDVIAKEYIQNRALDPPLGYILAMSRTKFVPTNKTDGAGLWNMDNKLVLENAYNGSCESETIAAPTQKCAAIASSIYVKDIIRDVFEGDIIYGVAAFGMSKNEAAEWRATLPPPNKRKDFWKVIKSPKQREQIVRFFAAATVAENPKKFGLKDDKPLSVLYKSYID